MTHKQRALAAIRGKPHDRVPFIGRMDLWHTYHANRRTLPKPYEGMSLWEIQRHLDIGLLGFGAWSELGAVGESFFRLEYRNMDYHEVQTASERRASCQTPYGELTAAWRLTDELHETGAGAIQTEHFFKSPSDYPAVLYCIENTEVVDNRESYSKLPQQIGEQGIALPFTGYVPIHRLMYELMGYEVFYYEWADNRDQIERLHQALWEQQMQIMQIGAQAPCEIIEVGGNYDEHLTPPPIFESHIVPFYQQACPVLHRGNKLVAIHGDGEMNKLLELMPQTHVDVVEAITPQPMTSIDLARLRELWADGPAIWGGVAAIVLTDTFADSEFKQFMDDLLTSMNGHQRFILGFGDNVPTDAVFDRVEYVAQVASEATL